MVKLADDVIAHILEQIMADDTDDGIEERNIFYNISSIVASFQERVDTCCQVVGQVIAEHALKEPEHIVLDAELVLPLTSYKAG